tara:strand:+ start:1302 stop:1910 length:609 start_codon:yes stop_codon:yes gene_type:complete
MKSISFAYTTPALLAGAKNVTRRTWKDSWGSRFKANEFIEATDKDKRGGGKVIGLIQLTERPRKEPLNLMPDEDFTGEGFEYLALKTKIAKFGMSAKGSPSLRLTEMYYYFSTCQKLDDEEWVIRFKWFDWSVDYSKFTDDGWPYCPSCGANDIISDLSDFTKFQNFYYLRKRRPNLTDYMTTDVCCCHCNWTGPDIQLELF